MAAEPEAQPALAVLERVAEAGGRLLRVEREPLPGPAGARESRVLRLVFDVGLLDLHAAAGGQLRASKPEAEALPVDAGEEDPWWALLGTPLARAQLHEGSSVLVQFRHDDDSPRIFVLEARGEGVGLTPLI
ncbi:MAG: hypothetical protein QNK05_17110 [Myxococcota bacterium]|nr:hypothetical protein [Myxococcota bacterium]